VIAIVVSRTLVEAAARDQDSLCFLEEGGSTLRSAVGVKLAYFMWFRRNPLLITNTLEGDLLIIPCS
jgi:hypothetical protein